MAHAWRRRAVGFAGPGRIDQPVEPARDRVGGGDLLAARFPFVQASQACSCHPALVTKRIVAYADGDDIAASRDFYVEFLGLKVTMEDPVLGLASPTNPTAQVLIPPRGMENPPPRFGIDVGDPAAVDTAHAEALRRGLRVVYPLSTEPWDVRRFFVEDPSGTVVNVLAHLT